MAEIAHNRFAGAVAERLAALQVCSFRHAIEKWPHLNTAMLSRACNGRTLSAGNYLLLCRYLGLDPFEFLIEEKRPRITMKSILNQAVTASVTRET
ncbi:hypothetical protein [Mesorhizobium sp. RMAD-H1]|uniref:hypothetical protein n=1 Tax=Mesorhizobium sp. RMAD-H1 TaxID=2587065 RepID=UPI00161B948D|nr:hypothetical protein [Mesorhizobium sp. RMAD-H1]MBB2973967.1 hypothetical protein [Mesorhizobium sp. RMAD-H1]